MKKQSISEPFCKGLLVVCPPPPEGSIPAAGTVINQEEMPETIRKPGSV